MASEAGHYLAMRWVPLLFALAATPALAQKPTMPPPAPLLDLDFTRMMTLDPRVVISRSATYYDWNCTSPPQLVAFGANQASLGPCDPNTGNQLGIGIWGSSTIANAWARDLTQSTWTPTNVTVAKDQTGADGAANAASSLTATGASGTVIYNKTITVGYYITSAIVKCITCTGKIYMTADGGQQWQDITGLLTANYRRVPNLGIVEQTGTSPGFKIANSGDKIAVDFVQVETDSNHTSLAISPVIETDATSNVVRDADVVTIDLRNIPGFNPDSWVAVIQTFMPSLYGNYNVTQERMLLQVDNGSTVTPPDNAEFLRHETDPLSNTLCNPPTNPGVVPYCPDFNISQLVNGVLNTANTKTRCSHSSSATSQSVGLETPLRAAFVTNVVAYTNGTLRSAGSNVNDYCNAGVGSGGAILAPWVLGGSISVATFNRMRIGTSSASVGGVTTTLAGPLNGYVQRIRIYRGDTPPAALLANLYSSVPQRLPGNLQLQGGGSLLYETGVKAPCNDC